MIHIGSEVGWLWLSSLTTGVVLEIYPNQHKIVFKGKRITRNRTEKDPALVIQHSKGSMVLKLLHEVQELSSHKNA
jgi:hypothetical protein